MQPQLREYQLALVRRTQTEFAAGHRAVCLQAPTGSGKTVIAARILHQSVALGRTPWMLAHRKELLDQIVAALRLEQVPYWVTAAGWHRHTDETPGRGVMVGSTQTVARRYQNLPPPNFMIFDEAHHTPSRTWSELFNAFPTTKILGLTATPQRADGKGLAGFFSVLVHGPQTRDLIALGNLAPYRLYAPPGIDLRNVHVRMGEFVTKEAETAVGKITGNIVAHYMRLCEGKQALVFAPSRKASHDLVDAFNACGVVARHVDGETPDEQRRMSVADFKAGSLKVLCNVDLYGEGVDLPAVDVLILARPTMSKPLYLQQVGRVLRPAPGKTALILDHVANVERHGLPDELRIWGLDGTVKHKAAKETVIKVRVCPECFAAQSPTLVCRYCGYKFEVNDRKIETVDGELVEILDPKRPWGDETQLKNMFMLKMPPLLAAAMARKVMRQRAAKQQGVMA